MKTGFSRRFSTRLARVSSSGSGGGGSGGGGAGAGSGPGRKGNLANLTRKGGDRYRGKRLILDAIEEALRTIENGREIREFFGLGPSRVLKQRHRDRWAEVKAREVYRVMVDSMFQSAVADYGGLRIGGFMEARAQREKKLYPVVAGKTAAVSLDQLDYVNCELMGFSDNFGVLPDAVRKGDISWYRWDSETLLARVPVSSKISVGLSFEGSGQTEQKQVECYGDKMWALFGGQYQWSADLSLMVPVFRWIENADDWYATATALSGVNVMLEHFGDTGTLESWNEARSREPSGWEFEFPVLGFGKGGSVPHIASLFPRRQRVYGVVDPVNANMSYGDIEYVDWDVWEAWLGKDRGAWLAVGAVVPPAERPPAKKNLAVTFDREFIAGIQPAEQGG